MKTARAAVSNVSDARTQQQQSTTTAVNLPPPPPPPVKPGLSRQLSRKNNSHQQSQGGCTHDLTKAVSLLALCVGLIVKGVSYDNSHWANQDEIDVVNNKDHFPIMTSFIGNFARFFLNVCFCVTPVISFR